MGRRSINRDIHEARMKSQTQGDSVLYTKALSQSPHLRHKKRAARILAIAEIIEQAKKEKLNEEVIQTETGEI